MTSPTEMPLEGRVRTIEDKLAIYQLLAAHPLSTDTGFADYTRSVYLDDGLLNRGPQLDGLSGVENIAASIERPEHKRAVDSDLAHFAGLPIIDLRGDRAIVTSYLMIAHLDHQGRPRHMPTHGMSMGYRIHRIVVDRCDLVRSGGQWMIAKRVLLPVDGSPEPRALLRQGLCDLQ